MSNIMSLRLPKTLHEQLKELARDEGVSLNQFVMLALAEKVATVQTMSYLDQRAARGSQDKLLAILAKAPDVEPDAYDRLTGSSDSSEG